LIYEGDVFAAEMGVGGFLGSWFEGRLSSRGKSFLDLAKQRQESMSRAALMYIVIILYISSAPAFLSGGERAAVLKEQAMGYTVKIQKVDRPTNRSYYLNFPVALAEALVVKKGEKFEWQIEDKNTLVLHRLRRAKARKFNKAKRKR